MPCKQRAYGVQLHFVCLAGRLCVCHNFFRPVRESLFGVALSGEIADAVFKLFKKHYGGWPAPLRKIGARGCNLVSASSLRQLTIFEDAVNDKRLEDLERTINWLRSRYGNKIVQRGIMHMDRELSEVDARRYRCGAACPPVPPAPSMTILIGAAVSSHIAFPSPRKFFLPRSQ